MKYLKIIFRLLIGVVFLISALLKLLSVDHFELYIYSFGVFNFFITTLLSRLLITFEFLLGINLIFKILYQKTWWISMLTMIGFTLFLTYVALFRNDTNCHCFGSFVELDPTGSILKNIVIILMLLLTKKQKEWNFKYRKLIMAVFIAIGLIGTFVVVPPDSLYNKIYTPKSKVNEVALQVLYKDSLLKGIPQIEGDHIVAFYVSGCKFCKLSIQKITQIFKNNNISEDKLSIIILGDLSHVEKFKEETGATQFKYYPYSNPVVFFNVVYGSFPTLLYMHGTKIEKVVNFRGIDEIEMKEFFLKK